MGTTCEFILLLSSELPTVGVFGRATAEYYAFYRKPLPLNMAAPASEDEEEYGPVDLLDGDVQVIEDLEGEGAVRSGRRSLYWHFCCVISGAMACAEFDIVFHASDIDQTPTNVS